VTVDRRIAIASLSLGPLLMMVGYAAMMLSPAGLPHRNATRWISMAVGTAAGTVVTVVVVGGGISLLAWMLSEPA
jgi:hypothetical protein